MASRNSRRNVSRRLMRIISLSIFIAMSFGFGVVVTIAGTFGPYAVIIGYAFLLLGALYGTVVGMYLWWRSNHRAE